MSSSFGPEKLKNNNLCPQLYRPLWFVGKFQKSIISFIYYLLLLITFRIFILFLRVPLFSEVLLLFNLYLFPFSFSILYAYF